MKTKELQEFINSLPRQVMEIESASIRESVMAGIRYERLNPSEETIRKVLSLYDNSFNGFKEDVKKKGIKYIQEHWNDENT